MTFLDVIIILASILSVGGLIWFIIFMLKKNKDNKLKGKNIDFDFTTKHGIRFKLSPLTKDLGPSEVEEWTEDLVQFWHEKKGLGKELVFKEISEAFVLIFDSIYIERDGQKLSGVVWIPAVKKVEITTLYDSNLPKDVYTPLKKVNSLFRHEISHIIIYMMDPRLSWSDHHALFAKVKLGA